MPSPAHPAANWSTPIASVAVHAPEKPAVEEPGTTANASPGRMLAALLLALSLHGLVLLLPGLRSWPQPVPVRAPLDLTLRAPTPVPAQLPEPQRMPLAPAPVQAVSPDPVVREPPGIVAPLAASPTPASPPARRPAVPARAPVRAPAPAPATALSPRVAVYGMDGRLRLPPGALEGEPPPGPSWVEAPREAAPWELRADPLVYEPTVLEPYWKPVDESLLGEFIRHNTHTRTFKLPDGTRVTCSWVLIIGGCGW